MALAKSIKKLIHPFKGSVAQLKNEVGFNSAPRTSVELLNLPVPKPKRRRVSDRGFVDLYCGAGGFLVGLRNAGLEPLVSADLNDRVKEAHELNTSNVPFVHGDISLPNIQDQIAKMAGHEPLLVAGGPPCQGFSVFGRRRLAHIKESESARDPRNRLVLSFVDAVAKINPRWVVMENVAGFASMADGAFVDLVVSELTLHGYDSIEFRILDAADYGAPQHRKRFVLIANRTGHIIPWPKKKFFATPKDWQKPFNTVGEAITDLAAEDSYGKHHNHVPMRHKPLQVERYKFIKEGERLDVSSLPDELMEGYRTKKIRNFSHIFKRLHREKPSITLVPGHNAFPIHPWLNRSLTVREAARLQTFPDEIRFVGARQDQCIQVGNAFPPMLAELIGGNIVRAETSGWFPGRVPQLARKSLLELVRA